MRQAVGDERVRNFLRAFGAAASEPARIYLTGGASAVLLGWRESTVDLDLCIVPEHDALFRAIPELKERLQVNVELASPADFIPEVPGWQERSRFIAQEGQAAFYHYDFYAQALSKVQRGHKKDLEDVEHMMRHGLVERERALELFEAIEPGLFRYPAIDPSSFRKRVEAVFGERERER